MGISDFAARVSTATTIETAMGLWREANDLVPSNEPHKASPVSDAERLALTKALSLAEDTRDLDRLLERYFEDHACSATHWRHHIRLVFERADVLEAVLLQEASEQQDYDRGMAAYVHGGHLRS